KNPKRPANQYSVQVTRAGNSEHKLSPVMTRDLYGMDWGLGYFKPKACDWCDDIAGETADLACGDAWLPEFTSQSMGTNIVVVRNAEIARLLQEGIDTASLSLSEQSVDKVYQSQAGNYRHRQEGLSVRIAEARLLGIWFPRKRINPESFSVSNDRKAIYDLREKIAARSHAAFFSA